MSSKKQNLVEDVARKAAGDGGNGETKMWFEGDAMGLAIPTAEIKLIRARERGNFLATVEVTPENIHEHLDLTFVSSKALDKNNERYLIGKKTLKVLGNTPNETDLNEAKKFDSKVVARTILAGLVVDAVRQKGIQKKIEMRYDLSLALPFIEVGEDNFQLNSERFIGTHEIIYHFPDGNTIELSLIVEFAMTLPESAIAGYAVVYDRNGNLKEYNLKRLVNGSIEEVTMTLEKAVMLISDIGAGTLDNAVMIGVEFDFDNSHGEEVGTKKTIERIRNDWNEMYPNDKITSLTQFTEIYSNEEDFNSVRLRNFSEDYLEDDATKIAKVIKVKMEQLPSNALVVLCGGGSILFKTALSKKLEKFADRLIFKKDAKFANAEGLIIFAKHPVFEEIKKNYLMAV